MIEYGRLIWYPHNFLLHHQHRFHNANSFKIKILIGGWASGKSLTTTIELINQMTIPQNMGFLGRYETPELMQSVINDIIFTQLDPSVYKHNSNRRTITFRKYKSSILYGFLNPSKLKNKMLGGSFGIVCIDQMEEIDEQIFEMLLGRLRREGTTRQFIANANPNGKDWIYKRFIENAQEQLIKPSKKYYEEIVKLNPHLLNYFTYETFPPYAEYINIKESSIVWVVSTFHNPFCPPDYFARLEKLPKEVRERFVEAKFTEFSGKIYKEFDERKHIYSAHRYYSESEIYVAIDPAVQGTTAVLFTAWDGKVLWVFDEIYEQGAYPNEIINKIRSKLAEYEIDIKNVVFLIDVASKKQYIAMGKTIYKDYIVLNPVPKVVDKLKAILNVKIMFNNNKIMIHKGAKNTIIEHNNYQWKDKLGGEEPLKRDDHTVDCLQYIVDELIVKHGDDIVSEGGIEKLENNENDDILRKEDDFHERLAKIRLERQKILRELKRQEGIRSWRM